MPKHEWANWDETYYILRVLLEMQRALLKIIESQPDLAASFAQAVQVRIVKGEFYVRISPAFTESQVAELKAILDTIKDRVTKY